jgi:glycerol-3-phosphate dehydrogenase
MGADIVDVLVVGGGVNGAGIARDLAGRGLRVLLAERDDLASHTSSASSKLVHGGLRYLAQGHLGLVRKSLLERERLLARNPHLMQPLRLVLPHDATQGPRWRLRAGLFLYDHLAPLRVSAPSRALALPGTPEGAALQARFTHAFTFSDGWVDDARLVLACALDAQAHGARILTGHACVSARPRDGLWHAQLREPDGREHAVHARALVNAAGPWASRFLAEALQHPRPPRLRLVQGTHVVVRRRWTHAAGYLLQNPDGRVLFALPFHGEFTLLGTTDVEVDQPSAQATEAEVDYLCTQASRWLREPVTPADVLHRWAGVRPLLDDAQGDVKAITRDYRLDLVAPPGLPPRLDVWGGKLTTFRLLAQQAADRLAPLLGAPRGAWTAEAPLPGGDCGPLAPFIDELQRTHPDRDPALVARWARAHGSGARALLNTPPGPEIAPGVCEAELRHAHAHEWAQTGDDFLWRRTKLGLVLNATQQAEVQRWFLTCAKPGGLGATLS